MLNDTTIRRLRKAIRSLKIKLGLKKDGPSANGQNKSRQRFRLSSFDDTTPVVDKKWRASIEKTCHLFDNYHVTMKENTVTELRNQSQIYRRELAEMRSEIEQLRRTREMLTRALETDSPKISSKPSQNQRWQLQEQHFIKIEHQSQMTPMRLSCSSRSSGRRRSSLQNQRDSAYHSSGPSPQLHHRGSHLEDLDFGTVLDSGYDFDEESIDNTIDNELNEGYFVKRRLSNIRKSTGAVHRFSVDDTVLADGTYMSNGYNTYFLRV